ncbi:MAG TPA: RagB/SusD family nutrient uptake outer membrane protein, partial [Agriterribacter sp.]|nr:RagB/SusD family nutrient uptake outer membrane protein [Agriterribacter sp.]
MKHMKKIFFILLLAGSFSCTKLEESFNSEISQNDLSSITAEGLLTSTYNSFATYQDGNFWHLQEHTSDEAIAPTRGPDWDDNGQWRALHAHTWNADHGQINGAFSDLLSAQFNASNVLQFNPSAQQAAEARFLRALTVFSVVDGWNQ